MRIAWRTVGAICERVAAGAMREIDLLDGLRRIGIEIQLATDALDETRREVWNEARRAGHM